MASRNRHFVGDTLAVLLCPAPNGKVFGVTIDKEDLPRVLDAGFWKVTDFGRGRGVFSPYCYRTRKPFTYLHRFIINAVKGEQVDHIHRRTLDNRKSELRKCDSTLNQLNRDTFKFSPNRTGHRGVYQTQSGRFEARTHLNRKTQYHGRFDTAAEAGKCVHEFLLSRGVFLPAKETL